MTSPHSTPITPEKQLTSKGFHIELDSPLLDSIDCTPNTKKEMMSRKRKVNQVLEEGSPSLTIPFLKWRLAVVENTLEVRASQRQALGEGNTFFEKTGISKGDLVAVVEKEERELMSEKAFLLAQRKSLEGDLNDVDTKKTQLEAAYITELRNSLELASKSKQEVPRWKAPRLDRKQFSGIFHDYLGTVNPGETGLDPLLFCHVLGCWLSPAKIECAHIVPFSFDVKETAHMFGSDESLLTSRRNGLSLHAKIEEAFDNCWVVIVPLDSVASFPTEWKIVLLNTAIKDNVFFEDQHQYTDREVWKWRDIDGRKLTFLNDNRPARRFLYMRYILAWLHAEDNERAGFKEKLPPGQVWASPTKPDGYLRKSILLELGRRTGDRLSRDLMSAGTFEDPGTSNVIYDAIAAIRVTETVQRHLDGERDPKEGTEEEDEEEEQEE